jgi:hypothetical protein
MLDGDFAAVLAPQDSSDDGAGLETDGVAGNVVRDGEESERVEGYLEAGGRGM